MSHIVITCTCNNLNVPCMVPGHDVVPADLVDPQTLVDAGDEAFRHLDDAVQSILKARAAWVSRGLPASNIFPTSLDRLAENVTYHNNRLRRWAAAAHLVARRRAVVTHD